jgi:hypothetical protein
MHILVQTLHHHGHPPAIVSITVLSPVVSMRVTRVDEASAEDGQ